MITDLGNHPTLTREEELERTTGIAHLRETLRELCEHRDVAAESLRSARSELKAALACLDLGSVGCNSEGREAPSGDWAPVALTRAYQVVEEREAQLVEIETRVAAIAEQAKAARDDFLGHNYRLVLFFARKTQRLAGPTVAFEDLVMQGLCGMIEALARFDPAKGCKFSTYAAYHIRSRISEFSYEQKTAIRVPMHRHRQLREISSFDRSYASANGRGPTDTEVAAFIGRPASELAEILSAGKMTYLTSLDAPLSDEVGAGSLGEMLPDTRTRGPEDIVVMDATITTLGDAFDRVLNPRERLILRMRYGLAGEARACNQVEIGQLLGLTRQRVCQIEASALRKLRKDKLVAELSDQSAAASAAQWRDAFSICLGLVGPAPLDCDHASDRLQSSHVGGSGMTQELPTDDGRPIQAFRRGRGPHASNR